MLRRRRVLRPGATPWQSGAPGSMAAGVVILPLLGTVLILLIIAVLLFLCLRRRCSELVCSSTRPRSMSKAAMAATAASPFVVRSLCRSAGRAGGNGGPGGSVYWWLTAT